MINENNKKKTQDDNLIQRSSTRVGANELRYFY